MKAKKKPIKKGHRESDAQHAASDRENARVLTSGYHKGDQHSGGGGRLGGGGKKGSSFGRRWEKGDVRRDENLESSVIPLRVKPGKRRRAG